MAENDYKKLVEDKEKELSDIYSRMDEDRELCELVTSTLKDADGNAIPNTIYITLNKPAVFAANVETALNQSSEQVVVESANPQLDTAYIEEFIRTSFRSADIRLTSRGWFPLNPFIDQQMCRRGRAAVRCVTKMVDSKDITGKSIKECVTELSPWDSRYTSYAMGKNGLDWAAYRTTRTKDQIIAEYPEQAEKISGSSGKILDIWTTKGNIVYLNNEKVIEQAHDFGECPVGVQVVTLGSMLADAESFKYQGESIFFLIRDLIPELNRLVSIIQNINMKALDRSKMWKSKDAKQEPPEYNDIDKPGRVIAAEIGGGADLMPIGEIQKSAYLLHSMIESAIQQGSLSDLDYGTLNFQLSAVALVEIGEGRDKVFLPRLGARGMLNSRLAEMIINQVVGLKQPKVLVGTRRQKREFDVSKLQGDYDIDFKYFVKSPKIDMARVSMATAYGNLIPAAAKRREVLVREDPDGDERQLRWESAEMISLAISMHRTIKALLEMADRGDDDARFEAELLSQEMGVNIQQMMSGKVDTTGSKKQPQQPQPLVPMFGNKVGPQTSARKPTGLMAETEESEVPANAG